jgi:hypothetical protein
VVGSTGRAGGGVLLLLLIVLGIQAVLVLQLPWALPVSACASSG